MKAENKSLFNRYIPFSQWICDYSFDYFKNDFRAGLTVSILLIPQSMAYAVLAGLPAVYGLYASTVPLIIYALFGTSRQLGLGPVAITSILVATGISELATLGSSKFIELVLITTFFGGVTQFLMGTFRLGFLMNFFSKPVLSGFTSAAALIIGFSQAGSLLGIDLPHSKYLYRTILQLVTNVGSTHIPTLMIGVSCIILIVFLNWWKANWPAQFLIVTLAIITVWFFQLDTLGVNIVGHINGGYPAPAMLPLTSIPYWSLLPTILAIAFLGFIQSIALAKVMVRRNPNYKVDSNQELFSIGLANTIGSFFHAYVVAGSFSRTAVNDENNAKTPISLVISAGLVMLTLFFLTPLIYYLPNAALAAIIITAVAGLVDIKEAKFLWEIRRREFTLMVITFAATISLGILQGIGIGVLISLGIVIHRSSFPNIALLGRLPHTDQYRDLERYPEGLTKSNTIIIRIDASLYFANISYVKERLAELEMESGKNIERIIFDAVGINEVDASAIHALKELVGNYKSHNTEVWFAGVKGPVRDIFNCSGLDDIIGTEKFYPDIDHAYEDLEKLKESSA